MFTNQVDSSWSSGKKFGAMAVDLGKPFPNSSVARKLGILVGVEGDIVYCWDKGHDEDCVWENGDAGLFSENIVADAVARLSEISRKVNVSGEHSMC